MSKAQRAWPNAECRVTFDSKGEWLSLRMRVSFEFRENLTGRAPSFAMRLHALRALSKTLGRVMSMTDESERRLSKKLIIA